ncbi:MAG: ABC transporter permease [Acidobacteriia bacterium]|nr:ABC transporter permease [Terriglobia bacterium]
MFVRMLYQSFCRQRRRKLLAGIAITLGVSVATAMIAVATDIGDKINRELRTYGANLVVTPDEDALDVEIGGVNLKPASDSAYLEESDLLKIKGMFWRHNIVGFAPMLNVPATVQAGSATHKIELLGTYFAKPLAFGDQTFTTGVRTTHPWWKVSGAWPNDDSSDILLGERLARQLARGVGDEIQMGGRNFRVVGVLSSDGAEDQKIVAPLALAQQLLGKPGAVKRVLVSAMTKPEDALARRDPKTMSPEMYDRWYCSPYANSIAHDLQQTIPHSRAEQIRQVAQNEGTVLERIKGLMLLVTLAALLASALAVSAAMATAIFERRTEVGLMKALGAGNATVATLFFAEAALLALLGGVAGYGFGNLMALQIGRWVFNSRIAIQPVLFPVVIGLAVFVTFAGSAVSIRKAMKFEPVMVLRGDA